MRRPLHTWIAFALCLAVVLGAMAWVSLTALRLDRSEIEARRQAALEERVRLALWRMDSALAPLIAQESARPYFAYTAFYPAGRAYTRMFAELQRGEILIPSPLLTQVSPHILVHFQFGPEGKLTSPQVPTGNMRDIAETGYVKHERIEGAAELLAKLRSTVGRDILLALLPESASQPEELRHFASAYDIQQEPQPAAQRQDMLNVMEWRARSQASRRAATQDQIPGKAGAVSPGVREGVMRTLWAGERLLLARRMTVNGQVYVQGCWLDWPAIRQWLLEDIRDLFPEAELQPVQSGPARWPSRMLTALPARLEPGSLAAGETQLISPIRLSLLLAWICVLLAAGAAAVLLLGALSLSERRASFVSAVTHELRTPLTTFRMYTEMLADKMLPQAEKRQRYLARLRGEAERLALLVENVLAYSRLERHRAITGVDELTIRELLDRVQERLAGRARQAGMNLVVEVAETAASVSIRVDPAAAEQILFNLVDNACKYASSASDRRIHLEADRAGDFAVLKVRDRGPGVAKGSARRLFLPFSKSARDAANSAPGVGLGLALSRRLARRMGGDLRLDESVKDGACFVLTLPVSG